MDASIVAPVLAACGGKSMKLGCATMTLWGSLALVGCGSADPADGMADDHGARRTSQAFTAGYGEWLSLSRSFADATLGDGTQFTPFLTGVTGNLAVGLQGNIYESVWAHLGNGGPGFGTANALIVDVQIAYSATPLVQLIGGGGGSVNSVANRIPEVTVSGSGGWAWAYLGPITANRRCFLTHVFNTQNPPTYGNAFGSASDELTITGDGSNWWLVAIGYAAGSAVCVDVTSSVSATSGSAGVFDLGPNTPGEACYFTDIRGSFRKNDWSDGVVVSYNGDAGRWQLSVSPGKFASAQCAL
jgi:hypothetical protein